MGTTRQQCNVLPSYVEKHIVIAPTGCWLWDGNVGTDGYARLYLRGTDGHRGKQVRAHRAIWEMTQGPVPSGLVLDHLCRVTICVRPSHLEPVTQQENMARSAVNGGALYVSPPRPLMCKYGHAYTPENARVVKRGKNAGCYECRMCQRLRRWWTTAKKWEAEHHVHAA